MNQNSVLVRYVHLIGRGFLGIGVYDRGWSYSRFCLRPILYIRLSIFKMGGRSYGLHR